MRVKEVLERGFADFYDAFADMDADRDGKVSLHDFQTAVKMLEGGDDLTSDQIDSAFNRCGVDADGLIVYKDFHAAFMGKAARTATDAGGITSTIIPRAFEEVRTLGFLVSVPHGCMRGGRCPPARVAWVFWWSLVVNAVYWCFRCLWSAKMHRACKSSLQCRQR